MTPTPPELESLAILHEQDARHLRALLLEMAEQGAEMARIYVQHAKDQTYSSKPDAGPACEYAAAYCNVSRSVRRTALLIQKLTEPAPAPKAATPGPDLVSARKQIIRRVEDRIHRDAPEHEAEQLHAELHERMEGPEFDDEIGRRPILDIVNEIRADLGLHGVDSLDTWMRLTPADIAVLCARAASPRGAAGAVPAGAPGDRANMEWPAREGAGSGRLRNGTPVAVWDG